MVTTTSPSHSSTMASPGHGAPSSNTPLQDALATLMPLLVGQQGLNDQIFEYLAPLDRAEFDAKRLNLDIALGLPNSTKVQKGARGAAIGKAFEELVIALLKGSSVFSYQGNIRSTIAEIDFLISILPMASCVAMLRKHGTHILGEAKCYTSGPKTEWVTELAGLMETHSATLSILFIGSKEAQLKREIRVAIALVAAKGKVVVPFGKTQIARVKNGENFLSILCEQYIAAVNHSAALWI
jgi:hypothetical protein